MADDTSIPATANLPVPPVVLSGQELYDRIMGEIEPELLSANVETLAASYEIQSPEERAERADRYRVAFDEYERRLGIYQQQWDEQLNAYKRHAIAYIEHQSNTGDEFVLQSIESSIDQ